MFRLPLTILSFLLFLGRLAANDPVPEDVTVKAKEVQSRIINGNEAQAGRYLYSVSLQKNGRHFCGGSLIAPNIVLTAGHCNPGTTLYVRAHINPYNLVSPGSDYQVFQIEEIRVHPYFNVGTKLSNDFSLLRLKGSSPNPPVELNTVGSEPTDNQPLVVIGWGTTVFGTDTMPNFLQEVEVTAMTNTECRNDYGSSAVSPQMLCCDESGQGACQGDSGGPLIIPGGDSQSDVQVGTVSWGIDCALPEYPGVYGRVSSGWPWIRQSVCEMADSPPAYFDCDSINTGGTRPSSTPMPVSSPATPTTRPPTGPPSPSLPQTQVLVSITPDMFPKEVGWSIVSSSGKVIVERKPGTYFGILPNEKIEEIVSVIIGETYTLVLIDSGGDGICCDYGDGSASVFLGTTSNLAKRIAFTDGGFGDEVDLPFTVSPSITPNSGAPSPAPTLSSGTTDKYLVTFTTDKYPSESHWSIKTSGGSLVKRVSLSLPNTVESTVVELTRNGTYVFVVEDEFGDGTCCLFGAGKAAIYFGTVVNEAKKVVEIDGDFGVQASKTFTAKDPSRVTSPTICFPGHVTCQVEGRGHVAMKDINLGDKVLVQGGKYEGVYSFGHRDIETEANYLKFVTSAGHVLEISEAHMVFVEGGRSVPASSIRVGDKVELADDGLTTIQSIKVVLRQGAFAPFTPSGTVVVNGVKASTFIAFQNSESLKIAGIDTGITFQFLGHAYESRQRLWCKYLSSCTDEQYSNKGMPLRLEYVHQAVRWYFNANLPVVFAVAIAVPVISLVVVLAYPIVGISLFVVSFMFAIRPKLRAKSVGA